MGYDDYEFHNCYELNYYNYTISVKWHELNKKARMPEPLGSRHQARKD